MVKMELSSVKNWEEAFWETALCSVNSSHSYCFPLKKPFAKTVLAEFKSDIWKPIECFGEKGKSSRKNWKEAFWETALCSVNSSHSYCFLLKEPFANTVLMQFSKWYLEALRGLRWKRTYLPLKTVRKLSEKLLCVLFVHLKWKRKYLPLKTGKKLSEKLLSVLLIHLTELLVSQQEAIL